MKITYKFDEKELFDFNMFRAMRKNSNTIPRAIFISCGYLAVLLLIGYWVKFPWWVYLIFTAAAVLLFFGMIWFTRNRMKHSVRVLMYRQSKEDIMPQTTLTLEDDYLEVYTVTRTSEIGYEDVERVEMTKQFLYILLTENGELGVPLRAFDDEDAKRQFITRLKAKTTKAVHVGIPYS
ncbi:MAG: hypothetical protein HFJ84_02565 [Clostridiales bacterium]|jgi:hypothetical protein|nr:hypothetical protein [Clostridiales bacterium]